MIHLITLHNDFTDAEFNFIWNQAKPNVQINYPFDLLKITDEEEQRLHMLQKYREAPLVWKAEVDRRLVALHAGEKQGDRIKWTLAMLGYDANGERRWIEPGPHTGKARDAFWASQGVSGWIIETYSGGSGNIDEYFKGKSSTRRRDLRRPNPKVNLSEVTK